jgi:hypothetical protein
LWFCFADLLQADLDKIGTPIASESRNMQ